MYKGKSNNALAFVIKQHKADIKKLKEVIGENQKEMKCKLKALRKESGIKQNHQQTNKQTPKSEISQRNRQTMSKTQ